MAKQSRPTYEARGISQEEAERRAWASVNRKPSGKRQPEGKSAGRKHSVRASIQVQELTKAGTSIEFEIYAGGEKIGTMVIGRGSLVWRGGRRQIDKKISWTRFAELMDELAYGPK